MEDHDGAYWDWKRAGLAGRTLLHFDAHIDFGWIKPPAAALLESRSVAELKQRAAEQPFWDLTGTAAEERTHLGNYIHQAMEAGIVAKFIWVYPDGERPLEQTSAVRGILDGLSLTNALGLVIRSQDSEGHFLGLLNGRPFEALPFSRLGNLALEEEVLLDVDVDFFVVRAIDASEYPWCDPATASCWLAPADFLRQVRACAARFDVATISYSVEEGYTPITLKFLGDELAARLLGDVDPAAARRFDALRAVHARDLTPAEKLRLLSETEPDAAVNFNIAKVRAETGDLDGAKAQYEAALAADPSYRSAYNHPGPVYEARGRREEAAASYAIMRRLDPRNPAYRLREFEDLLERRDWGRAAALGEELCDDGAREPELLLGLAECRFAVGEHGRARHWAGLCSASGCKPRLRPRLWELKARIAEKMRLGDEALACWQNVVRCAPGSRPAHRALARHYLFRKNLYKARRHAWKGFGWRRAA